MKSGVLRLYGILVSVIFFSYSHDSSATSNSTNDLPSSVKSLQMDGLQNFFQVTTNIYSGSAPENTNAFAELKKLGIKTIITVDGSKPDVATAQSFGLRYVQIPFGYDGIPEPQSLRLVKAVEILPGPFYIHCHHGIHRGPAGVAVICEAETGWNTDEAMAWLVKAGTDTNYAGLFKSVGDFKKPTSESLSKVDSNFPSISSKSRLADEMVKLDIQLDILKKKVDGGTPLSRLNTLAEKNHAALLIVETLKELPRTGAIDGKSPEFMTMLTKANSSAKALHSTLGKFNYRYNTNTETIEDGQIFLKQLDSLKNSCQQCHKKFRN